MNDLKKPILKGDGFVITESKPTQTILGNINGPRDINGIPAFTMQKTVDAAKFKARRLARPEKIDNFKSYKIKLESLIKKINREKLKPKGLGEMKIPYATKDVAPDYSGPIALIIPEIHLFGEHYQNDQGTRFNQGTSIQDLFDTNLELLKALVESKLCKDFVHEGAMQLESKNPNFDANKASQQGILMYALAGIDGISVNSGERPETQIGALCSTILQFAVCNKFKAINLNPKEMSSKSIQSGIENMILNVKHILEQSTNLNPYQIEDEVSRMLKAKIKHFQLEEFVTLDSTKLKKSDPFSLVVSDSILKLDMDCSRSLINWIYQEGTVLSAYRRDEDLLDTVKEQPDGLIPTVVGAMHTPNLVINELEESGIPVIIASTELDVPKFDLDKDSFDLSKKAKRDLAKRAKKDILNQAESAKNYFLRTK